jgi:hypothetical protein
VSLNLLSKVSVFVCFCLFTFDFASFRFWTKVKLVLNSKNVYCLLELFHMRKFFADIFNGV